MTQIYTRLFSQKYLDTKFLNFNLLHIHGLSHKKQLLHNWRDSIRSGKIIKAKEEQLQADFLNTIFGEVLDYTYTGASEWNLQKEHKSGTDATKADGALGYFSMQRTSSGTGMLQADVRAVIELKDARTDLDKPQNRKNDKRTPVSQAFDYASKSGGNCRWVIVSNFLEIRLYNYAAGQSRYERFDLTRLEDDHELLRFFFLLHKDRLLWQHGESPADKLYRERQEEEKTITKRFYSEYRQSRISLFRHLAAQNPAVDELIILNKTQKLLDRVIFVCFCEDKGIIPPYTFRGLLQAVKDDRFNRSDNKIYNRVTGLFHAIDTGFPEAGINRFNGGLFAPNADLDNLSVKDSTLEHIIELEKYDFDSDLNVNILGHIFEQSISDIEELKASLAVAPAAAPPAGEQAEAAAGSRETPAATVSRRKKDGIFYTPEYITRYIVEEAVGGWLEDRQQEIGFGSLPELTPDDYASISFSKKGILSYNQNIGKHLAAWEAYKEN